MVVATLSPSGAITIYDYTGEHGHRGRCARVVLL